MEEPEADASEALFMVVASLVGELVEKGVISAQRLANMQSAFEMQAAGTRIPQSRANAALAAQYAEVLAAMARMDAGEVRQSSSPHLRVVPSDDGGSGPSE